MNNKTSEAIRTACERAKEKGLRIHQGPWFEWSGGKVVGCCAIGAVLLEAGKINPEGEPDLETSVNPGYVKAACQTLGVNASWLYRFWMGFDRGYQIMLIDDKEKESKDDISAFGIQLRREFPE
jgi:hypothetical protein